MLNPRRPAAREDEDSVGVGGNDVFVEPLPVYLEPFEVFSVFRLRCCFAFIPG